MAYLLAWKPHVTRSWIISERGEESKRVRPMSVLFVRSMFVRGFQQGTSLHQNGGGPRLGSGGLTLDLYVLSSCAIGIISKSVAHACSVGARGLLRSNDQEYGKASGVVKFYRDQEKPGMYVSEFKGPCSGFVRGTRTEQRRGSYIHVVVAGIRTPAATEHAPKRRML